MSICRGCGCTDDRACPGGCFWVEDDLCSACVELAPFSADDLSDEAFGAAIPNTLTCAHSWLFTSTTDAYCVHCGVIRPPELDEEAA